MMSRQQVDDAIAKQSDLLWNALLSLCHSLMTNGALSRKSLREIRLAANRPLTAELDVGSLNGRSGNLRVIDLVDESRDTFESVEPWLITDADVRKTASKLVADRGLKGASDLAWEALQDAAERRDRHGAELWCHVLQSMARMAAPKDVFRAEFSDSSKPVATCQQ